MPLQQALTDSHGISVPGAYGVITDWNLQGLSQVAVVTLSWYASSAAFNSGYDPFRVDKLTLSDNEQRGGESQLLGVLYSIIAARSVYSGASLV